MFGEVSDIKKRKWCYHWCENSCPNARSGSATLPPCIFLFLRASLSRAPSPLSATHFFPDFYWQFNVYIRFIITLVVFHTYLTSYLIFYLFPIFTFFPPSLIFNFIRFYFNSREIRSLRVLRSVLVVLR